MTRARSQRIRSLGGVIAAGESDSVEFKAKWNERALEDLAAFANHLGGTLLVGVSDDGSVCGFSPTEKKLQVIANQITDRSA